MPMTAAKPTAEQGNGGGKYPLEYLHAVLGLVSLERSAPRYGAARAKP